MYLHERSTRCCRFQKAHAHLLRAIFQRTGFVLRRILHALLSYKDETLLETARWELNVRKIPEKHR